PCPERAYGQHPGNRSRSEPCEALDRAARGNGHRCLHPRQRERVHGEHSRACRSFGPRHTIVKISLLPESTSGVNFWYNAPKSDPDISLCKSASNAARSLCVFSSTSV